MTSKLPLPIDALLPEIAQYIADGRDIILKASPGSGKTTRVPPALLPAVTGEIWVLEPRRLAARMSASRVADELGEKPGGTVGWQMRFDVNISSSTRVIFLTEGMFTSRLAQNPTLNGVSCVILDEFHERHQQTDVAFALLAEIRKVRRPDLRVIVMSATLDTAPLVKALPNAELIDLELPLHPVRLSHWNGDHTKSVVDRVVDGVDRTINDAAHSGHILVFLPGTAEIIKTRALLQNRLPTDKWLVLELRGSLDKNIQDLAFKDTPQRKVILSTNIAESSITIPGITAVVDSGLARVPSFNIFTGLSSLETKPVAQSSLIQRAGRAGRTGPGVALRLFSKQDEAARVEVDAPEILRLDLAPVYYALLWISKKTGSLWTPETLPWLANPGEKAWDDARKLLRILGFTDHANNLRRPDAPLLPVHPRIAKFAEALVDNGYGPEAPWLTAILASPDDVPPPIGDNSHLACDLLARYETLRSGRQTFHAINKSAQQISRLLKQSNLTPVQGCRAPHEMDLSASLLKAFPDRVMMIRNRGIKSNWIDGTLCTGGDLRLSRDSAAAHGDWIVALDASSTRVAGSVAAMALAQGASASQVTVTMASQITSEILTANASELLTTEEVREWDEKAGKSRVYRKTKYGVLQLSSIMLKEEDSSPSLSGQDEASHLLMQLRKSWPKPFESSQDFDSYLVRQRLAYDAKLTDHVWNRDELFELLLSHICDEAKSFGEIAARPLIEWLRHCVGEDEFSQLQRVAPLTITVGAGHKVKIHYSEASPPWIEARLQNFFGQASTPKIMEGRQPLTLHLLAPNMRALQVTTDLPSFWQRIYPALRNEYQRKYPRHYWPEDPMAAEPPPMKPPRKPR